MFEYFAFSIRIGGSGRSGEIRLGRNAFRTVLSLLVLGYALAVHLIYDYRVSRSELGELSRLRLQVSEQNLTLYHLHAKFEGIQAEVDRIRALDSRVKSLVALNETLRSRTRRGGEAQPGVGGAEIPAAAADRIDRLLDLRFEALRENILVGVENLDIVAERLDADRNMLESVPSLWPVRGILSSVFGIRLSPFTETKVFHEGIDIDAPTGTAVRAAAPGRVVRSGYEPLYGHIVVVEHGYGYRTLYGHLDERLVQEGGAVRRGDSIGKVGDTGRTTGPHLHYEVHVNGLPVNPSRFLN